MKKHIIRIIALTLALSLLVGCTPQTERTPGGEKIYRYADATDVNNLSPHMSLAAHEGAVVNWTTSTFYRWLPKTDRSGSELLPDMAAEDPIDVNGDGTVWEIRLREGLKWDNGDPIDANTFMYSYKMALDPKMANQTVVDLAKNAIIIKNAEAYYAGKCDWEDVGIKQVDDHTLHIMTDGKFTAFDVKRHFAGSRATCPVYQPLYEELMNEDGTSTSYGTSLDKVMGAGPFKLVSWTKDSERILAKNPDWVYADRIKVDKIEVRIIPDANTRLQMFENGELDYIGLSQQTYEMYKDDPRVKFSISTEIISFDINGANTEKPILGDPDFRRALYYGLNREKAGEISTHEPYGRYLHMIAAGFPDEGVKFWDLPEAQATIKPNHGYDPELAKQLFEKAMANNGYGPNDKLTLNMIYAETSSLWKLFAEFVQAEYAALFGEDRFEITLTAMPYAQAMDLIKTWKTNPNAYELAWAGWIHGGSLFNPCIQFMFFSEDYFNLNSPPPNDKVTKLYAESLTEEARLNQERLVELAIEMEKAMVDDVYVVPVVNIVSKFMFSERMVLPFDEYDPILGWAAFYADIDLSK